MDTYSLSLAERLRDRERELLDLHESFREVRQKFAQLEHTFEINLQSQQKREIEFNLLKYKSQENVYKPEAEPKSKKEFQTLLREISNERDQWKQAFLQQKAVYKRSKMERENFVKSIKQECENILMVTWKSAEKHFHEIVQLYENALEKSSTLQKQLEKYEQCMSNTLIRSLELANLLDTLQHFDIDVDFICRNTAEALRSLNKTENVYEEKLLILRQLTWEFKKKKDKDSEQNLLRIQNSVLRHIVKGLKRKLGTVNSCQATKIELLKKDTQDPRDFISMKRIPSKDNESDKSSNYDSMYESERGTDFEFGQFEKRIKSTKNSKGVNYIRDRAQIQANSWYGIDPCEIRTRNACHSAVKTPHQYNSPEEFNVDSKTLYIETFESHFNGIPYEEHVLHFARKQEIKIKYSPLLINYDYRLKVEFLDEEEEYLESAPQENKLYVFLRDTERIIKLKNNGINSGVQTKKTKLMNNYSQTTITATYTPFRLNVGATMLNNEKRTIERSLGKLERIVADLKFNALGQARTLMHKDSKFSRNDEFFECVRLLAH